jgi:NAD(P)-dependent dehydrogenase (short-subunit alcohol dehydrogenase family)
VRDWLELSGRRVLIAGGAGTLGAAVGKGFAEQGAAVGVIDLDTARLEYVEAGVRVGADLSSAQGCRDAVERARAELGGVDVFIHCVGINDRKPIEEYDEADWDKMLAVNLSSAFHTSAAVAPAMREQGRGRIIFFSSVAGRSGHRNHGPYAATKGAINQLTKVMANEYAAHGVTVNALAPGYMDTALTHAYLEDHPGARDALIELIPAGRFGTLDEVVQPVLFLASDRASFITGQVVYVDGGRSVV